MQSCMLFCTFMSCFLLLKRLWCFLFQLTALVVRGTATRSEKFIVSLDGVAIKDEKVRGVFLCVQCFVRSPHLTQRISSPCPAWQYCLSLLLFRIALLQVRSMPHGVLRSQHVQAKSSLICVLVEIGLCCPVALPKTPVSAGIMVAALGVRQHQSQGWEFHMSLRRGALNMCQSFLACSWSSSAKQISFFPQQAEEKNFSEPQEVTKEIWNFQSSS